MVKKPSPKIMILFLIPLRKLHQGLVNVIGSLFLTIILCNKFIDNNNFKGIIFSSCNEYKYYILAVKNTNYNMEFDNVVYD